MFVSVIVFRATRCLHDVMWSREAPQSLFAFLFCFFILDELIFNYSSVQLKINNQALDSAFTPVSPGEVFKVYG